MYAHVGVSCVNACVTYLHLVEESAGGEKVVSLLGVFGAVLPRPVRLARTRHADHKDHLLAERFTFIVASSKF